MKVPACCTVSMGSKLFLLPPIRGLWEEPQQLIHTKVLMGHQILDTLDPHICPFPELVPELCREPMTTLVFPTPLPYRGKTLSPTSHKGWLKPSTDWQPSWP